MPGMGEYVMYKNYKRKIKSPFFIYADFERILVPENNEMQNSNKFCTKKCQEHIACRFGQELVCSADAFSEFFKSYLGEDAICNFINCVVKESKYCTDVIKKHFNKKLIMTKTDDEDFRNSTQC